MKKIIMKLIALMLLTSNAVLVNGQQKNQPMTPNLSTVKDTSQWDLYNRTITVNKSVYLDKKLGEGLLLFKGINFSNGIIEADIKGKDERGSSFVGIAFHVLNESNYDAVYFRPFNFKDPERSTHSVQYIAHPEHTWFNLRSKYPNKYENEVKPVPEPTEWFHVKIVVEYPTVKAYVNNSDEPSLIINQLSSRKEGLVGFWVGNTSDGYFKNLKIHSK